MKTIVKVLLLIGALALPATAKEVPPPGGEPKAFILPETETMTLENGLRATFIEFGIVPKVEIRVVVRTGNLNEDGKVWVADILGEMLKEGAGDRSSAEIATAAADMGGGVSINVGPDQTAVGMDLLSEYGADAVALIADIVARPALPASELDRIRQDFIRNLSVARSQPQPQAREAFLALLYGDHAYGTMFPSEEQLRAYGIDDLTAYYRANFGAARTHVFVSGQFDEAAMRAAIEAAFGEWERGPDALIDVPEPASSKRVKLIGRPEAPQSTIFLGLPVLDVTHPDYVALQVTNSLLGGSFGSRITSNIREDKGYTYSPRSSLSNRYHDTYWAQRADITSESTGAALKEIYFEIDRLQSEPPAAEELDRIKNYRAGIFVLQNATRSGLITQLNFLDLQGLDRGYLTDFVRKVYAVTPEDVSRMAREQLRDEDMTLVVVGDLATVTEQLKALEQLDGVAFEN